MNALTKERFVALAAEVFEKISGVPVAAREFSMDAVRDDGAVKLASIRFEGDYDGAMTLYAQSAEARRFVDALLALYALEDPAVKDEDVIAEFINIYGAHLITALTRSGFAFNITPPNPAEKCSAQPYEAFCFSLTAGNGWTLIVHLSIDARNIVYVRNQ